MCKDSCGPALVKEKGLEEGIESVLRTPAFPLPEREVNLKDTQWILNAEYYSEDNKERILNITYDYKDEGPEPPDGKNTARNITSVATAASESE
jgi:hypothetical protein